MWVFAYRRVTSRLDRIEVQTGCRVSLEHPLLSIQRWNQDKPGDYGVSHTHILLSYQKMSEAEIAEINGRINLSCVDLLADEN